MMAVTPKESINLRRRAFDAAFEACSLLRAMPTTETTAGAILRLATACVLIMRGDEQGEAIDLALEALHAEQKRRAEDDRG